MSEPKYSYSPVDSETAFLESESNDGESEVRPRLRYLGDFPRSRDFAKRLLWSTMPYISVMFVGVFAGLQLGKMGMEKERLWGAENPDFRESTLTQLDNLLTIS